MFIWKKYHWVEIFGMIQILNNCLATRFVQHPVGKSILEGDSAELSCKIRRLKENQEVYWLKDDIKLINGRHSEDDNGRYTVKSVVDGLNSIFVFTITPTNRLDTGIYMCGIVSSGGNGVVESNGALLEILEIPQERYPECKPIQNRIIVNDLITLHCTTEIITPAVNLSWTVNGTYINSETIVNEKIKTIQYQFRARKIDQSGVFVCVMKSEVLKESRNCSIGPINLLYKPDVKIHHTSNNIILGREIFMVCHAHANPRVKNYTWKFTPLIEKKYIYIDDSTQVLRLFNITADKNNTVILCTASNEVGSETDQVKLYVKSMPNDQNFTISVTSTDVYGQPEVGLSNKISLPLPIIVTCAVTALVIIIITIVIPIYFLCFCNKKIQTKQEVQIPIDTIEMQEILQPDYYFEPCDRVLPRIPNSERHSSWRKHIGVQVPEDDYDIASTSYMYMTLNEPRRTRDIDQYRRYHTLNPMGMRL